MKKNNKGFIAISTIYSFIVVFLLLMIIILNTYYNNRTSFDVYKNSIKTKAALGYSTFGQNTTYLYNAIINLSSTTSTLDSGVRLNNDAYRFFGSAPNNYICLNVDVTDPEKAKNNCVTNSSGKYLYRIIGAFRESTFSSTGGSKYLTKIVRYQYYSYTTYHSSLVAVNWENSSLCNTLNNTFYTAYNGITGNYQNMIADAKWGYLRTGSLAVTANSAYNSQKSSGLQPVRKVGLLSAADYGYASYFTTACATTHTLNQYNYGFDHLCYSYNWMKDFNKRMWLIDQTSAANRALTIMDGSNKYNIADYAVNYSNYVYPALYLKSDVVIIGGSGTRFDPYLINMF